MNTASSRCGWPPRHFRSALTILICAATTSWHAAAFDEPIRGHPGVDLGVVVGGVTPVTGDHPNGALLLGGDARLRYGLVSLGARLEKSVGLSPSGTTGTYAAVDSITRVLGTLGFNLALNDRMDLSPYLGVGSSNFSSSDGLDGRVGLEVEYFLTRFWSLGGGLAFDVRVAGRDGLQGSGALTGVFRLTAHVPLE